MPIFSVDHACGDDTAYIEDPAYVKKILAESGNQQWYRLCHGRPAYLPIITNPKSA